jgi:D-alanyl-D-alanine carboxypeptidase
MTRTTFRNASGLPHSKQRSTARDMARLAVAMRRDFPQYYDVFSAESFNWKGQKFRNHNKLLSAYSGTDGIKTGYINASGFNLVASVERRGIRLIGVVFGGRSGRTRDKHMMQILDASFKRAKPADLGTQVAGVRVVPQRKTTMPPTKLPVAPPERPKVRANVDVSVADASPTYLEEARPGSIKKDDFDTIWSVQIGSFARRANAHKAAAQARRAADSVLGQSPARLTLVTRGDMPLWRVRFNNLDEDQARSACAALFAKGRPCFAVSEQIKRSG